MLPVQTLVPSLVVAGSGVLWGVWWIPLRWLEASGLSGDWAGVALYAAAIAVLAPFLLRDPGRLRRGGRDLLLIGLFSGVAFAAWNHALIAGDVVRVTLLFYLSPIWGTALGVLFFRDPIRLLRAVSILLGLAGAAVVLGLESGLPLPRSSAEWLALGSGLLFAFAAVYSRRALGVGGFEKTFLNCVFAGISSVTLALLLPAGPLPGGLSLERSTLPLLACLAWQIPVTWMLLWGAARLDAGRVGILLLLEVIAAAVSAALLTDEPFGLREGLGCVLIVAAGLVEGFDEILARRTRAPRGS